MIDLSPSPEQILTLKWIGMYAGIILFLTFIPFLKLLLWPFKILVVALHEFSHAIVGCATGARIESIELDPNQGGLTKMRGGNAYLTLPAGYLGSAIWGSLMVFAGFDAFVSKVMACAVGLAMLLTLFWARNWLPRLIVVFFIGLIAVAWWFDDAYYLKYLVLFLGVMSCLYSVNDILEDLVFRRVNVSDASRYSKLCCSGLLPPQFWGLLWFIISLGFLGLGIVLALIVFKTPVVVSL